MAADDRAARKPAWIRGHGRGLLLVALLAVCTAAHGDAGGATRFQRLGAQLICTCGCNQGMLVCNHVGCPVVTKMRDELTQRAGSSDSDALVLQSFVQEYGTQVLAVPPARGFNLLAWIMPWLAAGIGLALVLGVVRQWRARPAAAAAAPAGADNPTDPALLRVREELGAELRRED